MKVSGHRRPTRASRRACALMRQAVPFKHVACPPPSSLGPSDEPGAAACLHAASPPAAAGWLSDNPGRWVVRTETYPVPAGDREGHGGGGGLCCACSGPPEVSDRIGGRPGRALSSGLRCHHEGGFFHSCSCVLVASLLQASSCWCPAFLRVLALWIPCDLVVGRGLPRRRQRRVGERRQGARRGGGSTDSCLSGLMVRPA